MRWAGLGPVPMLLGFVLAGLEAMKQLYITDRMCGGEGSAWGNSLTQLGFLEYLRVDFAAPT